MNMIYIVFISIAILCMVSCNGDSPAEDFFYTVMSDSDSETSITSQSIQAGETILWTQDSFSVSNDITYKIKSSYGFGGDRYYGGDEDVIFDTYYETEYTLR